MKHRTVIWTLALISITVILSDSCKKTEEQISTTALAITVPEGFPPPENIFAQNPISQEGFDLGRKLFYDGRLSKDGSISCASCHQQFAAFSTFEHALSHGIGDNFTTRNAPGLFNLAWHKEFHWDGGINHLEVQPLGPITAANEMAETIESVITKLNADEQYRKMFKAAFGSETADSQRMLKALAQFMGMMVSAGSTYDKVKNGKASFTLAEQAGYLVFQAKCASCHQEPLFTDLSYRNTGLPIGTGFRDLGRLRITGKSTDSLKFKVPSLRNIELTAPYGHDGRFYSISAVIDHYRFGVVDGPTTDPLVRKKISLTSNEKADLISFLKTLTDLEFTKDKRFAQPVE